MPHCLAVPSLPGAPRGLEFTTEGSTFGPRLVAGAGTIEWHGPTGVEVGAAPDFDFGSAARRRVSLKSTPASAITTINLGYDQGDEGPATIALLSQQNVSAVHGLQRATGLQRFAASHCPLTELDAGNLPNLVQLELYLCQQMARINLRGSPNLQRVCFEDNALAELDLTDQGPLLDLRGALNSFTHITWPVAGMPNLWHMCLRDNPQLVDGALPNLALYPSLREIWLWNCNQSGVFTPHCVASADLRLNQNRFTLLDLSNCSSFARLECWSNRLTSVTWGTTTHAWIDFTDNLLPQAQVDAALIHARDYGTTTCTVRVAGSGNAVPSATGLAARDAIVARGGSTQVNS